MLSPSSVAGTRPICARAQVLFGRIHFKTHIYIFFRHSCDGRKWGKMFSHQSTKVHIKAIGTGWVRSRKLLSWRTPNFRSKLHRNIDTPRDRRLLKALPGVALIHRRSKQYVGVRVKGSYSVACVWKISYPLSYLGYVNFSVGRGADARVQYAPV